MTSVNLAIVDDHGLFRKVLKSYLSDQNGFRVVFDSANVFDLFNKLQFVNCDILLMDLFLPELIDTDILRKIHLHDSSIKVIILSMCHDLQVIADFLDQGIHAYISKADDPAELIKAINAVAENRIYRNKLFTEALYYNKQNDIKIDIHKKLIYLSEREKKIINLLWEEKSNKEIADEVYLSVRSIEKIRQDMKEKLGIKSTIGLLKYAITNKIIGVNHSTSKI